MCFSAAASFVGGAVISGVGVATEKAVKEPAQRLFASIPMFFAVQQFAEGVVWLILKSGGYGSLQNFAAHVFLAFALVGWPAIIPVSMYLIERDRTRKLVLVGLIIIGSIVSIYNTYSLFRYPITPQIQDLHIIYNNNFPSTQGAIPLFYGLSVIIPLFVSSFKRVWMLGVAITISLIVTIIYFSQFLTSIWCFFAALLSIMIYWIIKESSNNGGTV
jgi:hypothetical protein